MVTPDRALDNMATNTVIPIFACEETETWFRMLEACWHGQDISDEQKFRTVVTHLPIDIGAKLTNILTNPPSGNKYDSIKSAVLETVTKPLTERLDELEAVCLDGRRPSQLWAHMNKLNQEAGSPYTPVLLRRRFRKLLPLTVQMCLAGSEHLSDDKYTKVADTLVETQSHAPSSVHNVTQEVPTPPSVPNLPQQEVLTAAVSVKQDLTQKMDGMGERIAQLEAAIRSLGNMPPSQRQSLPVARPRQEHPGAPAGWCFYHYQFGDRARNCRQPCSWPNPEQPPPNFRPRASYTPAGNAPRGGWRR